MHNEIYLLGDYEMAWIRSDEVKPVYEYSEAEVAMMNFGLDTKTTEEDKVYTSLDTTKYTMQTILLSDRKDLHQKCIELGQAIEVYVSNRRSLAALDPDNPKYVHYVECSYPLMNTPKILESISYVY
jgi:hypothetical protein